jgi:hypothetical protein
MIEKCEHGPFHSLESIAAGTYHRGVVCGSTVSTTEPLWYRYSSDGAWLNLRQLASRIRFHLTKRLVRKVDLDLVGSAQHEFRVLVVH